MYDELVKKIRHCATDPMHCLSCGEVKDGRCFKRLMTQAADAIEELSKSMTKTDKLMDDVKVEFFEYDEEEIHPNCTVQIWRNSKTGEYSIGWWENGED